MKKALDLKGLNSDKGLKQLKTRSMQADISKRNIEKDYEMIYWEVKRSFPNFLQVSFTNLSEKLPDGFNLIMS